jgi:signal peptidase
MNLRHLSQLGFAAMLVAWFVLLRPTSLGGTTSYSTVSGSSMEPRLHTGDLVIAQVQASYAVGDVVVFRVPAGESGEGSHVVHRIIGGHPSTGFVMQGDNKDAPDPWQPTASDIVGRSWFEVPGGGNLLLILRRPIVLASLLGGLAALWILTSGSDKRSTGDTVQRRRVRLRRAPTRGAGER